MERSSTPTDEQILRQAFARLDRTALGVAVGIVTGAAIFLATIVLVYRGGDEVGPHLALLGQYFIGYSVTWGGSFVGLLYGLIVGFLGGWLLAALYNFALWFVLSVFQLKAQLSTVTDFVEPDEPQL